MLIGVPAETLPGETRVAVTPETVKKLKAAGHTLRIQSGAGVTASATDEALAAAGAEITDAAQAWACPLVLKVRPPSPAELAQAQSGATLVGMLNPFDAEGLQRIAAAGLTSFALEAAPRTTRAQSMDVLSSQANIAGYKAVMEAAKDPAVPTSITLMGGPIDTRRSPTAVNKLAQERGIEWFQRNCVVNVPFPYPGMGRSVYPGFLQLSGFMAMNMDRHVEAHGEMFRHLVAGDGDSAEKHRDFYNEYLAVMDLTAEFYLQTVDTVFVKHALPKGTMMHRDKPVDLSAIRRCALMTVEGENDDISGVGQTKAAHTLCVNIPDERRAHWMQPKVGHYGVFNGSRFRAEIAPRMKIFIEASSQSSDMTAKPAKTSVQKRGPGRLKLVESIS